MATKEADLDKLVDLYVKLRDHKKALTAQRDLDIAKVQEGMDKIASVLAGKLDAANAESVRTESGTFFKVLKESVTVANRETFYEWAVKNNQLDLLDIRAAKTNVVQWKNTKGDLPPGLNYSAEVEVQVRRS